MADSLAVQIAMASGGGSSSSGLASTSAVFSAANSSNNSSIQKVSVNKPHLPPIQKKKKSTGVLTAADLYEPGFRIPNAHLCTKHTRLLVLITSAAAPAHAAHRQAIRMTWMARYGRRVAFAFLLGTPSAPVDSKISVNKQRKKRQVDEESDVSFEDFQYHHNFDKDDDYIEEIDRDQLVPPRYTDEVVAALLPLRRMLRNQFAWSQQNPNPNSNINSNPSVRSERTYTYAKTVSRPSVKQVKTHDEDTLRKRKKRSVPEYAEDGDYEDDGDDSVNSPISSESLEGLNPVEIEMQKVIISENRRYGDIVQARVRDVYNNLTLKSIAGLEWTRDYCPGARYLLKTDDDMFIDVRRLLRFIDKVEHDAVNTVEKKTDKKNSETLKENGNKNVEMPPTIWGRLAHGWRPIRTPSSKYFVSKTQYVGRVFPDFCTGPAYLMTRAAVVPLYEGALGRDYDLEEEQEDGTKPMPREQHTPYLKLEDVYLTGVVAERLGRRATELERREHERKEREKIRLAEKQEVLDDDSGLVAAQYQDAEKDQKDAATAAEVAAANKKYETIVRIKRVDEPQFANRRLKGRELERAICSGVGQGSQAAAKPPTASLGWSWWDWDYEKIAKASTVNSKNSKANNKRDPGVLAVHMVQFHEQFELWRRIWDARVKCGVTNAATSGKAKGKT